MGWRHEADEPHRRFRHAGRGARLRGLCGSRRSEFAARAPLVCDRAGASDGEPPAPELITSGPGVWSFVSAPRLRPMRVSVTAQRRGTAPGKIFVGPYTISSPMIGQTGALISDNSGQPVWFRPLPSTSLQNADFKVQTYYNHRNRRAEPVLTWWQGSIAIPPAYTNLPGGAPEPGGCYYIYDSHYKLVRTVFARHGFHPDEHEFTLTRRGTALFIATKPVPMDLRPYGGPQDGAILDSEVQEVDLATGELVFSWDILDHVNPADSEVPASDASSSGGVWDAYHMNSIDEGPNGELLISTRNMWAVYDIFRRNGRIRWQLGGKKSAFTFGPNADFFWQHDARFRPGRRISMFDDGCCSQPDGTPEQESHGLILNLDFAHRRATVDQTYYHAPPLFSASQGNTQALPTGTSSSGGGRIPTTRSTPIRGTPRTTASKTFSTTQRCRAPTSPTVPSATDGSASRTTHRVQRHEPGADAASSTPRGTDPRRPEGGNCSPDPIPAPCGSSDAPPHRVRDRARDSEPGPVLPGQGA